MVSGGMVRGSSTPLYISHLMPYLLAVILMGYYSGVLLSYLTVQRIHLPFHDIKGLIEDGSYRMSSFDNTYTMFHFKVSRIEGANEKFDHS